MKTNVSVDGSNRYYGCLKGTPYRWLNLARLCQQIVPRITLNRLRYFTALGRSRPGDPQQAQRQPTDLRALQTLPDLSIHYGHFLSSRVRMRLAAPPLAGARTVEVIKTEEKGSDVNLATYLLWEGFAGDYEQALVITNDSDLAWPIALVRRELKRPVGVLYPPRKLSVELQRVASFVRPIRPGALSASQFPPTLRDARGVLTKPAIW